MASASKQQDKHNNYTLMHYKNGRPASFGDPVIFLGGNYPNPSQPMGGVISALAAGTEGTCNCNVTYPVFGGVDSSTCMDVGQMYHAQDAWAAIEAQNKAKTLPLPTEGGDANSKAESETEAAPDTAASGGVSEPAPEPPHATPPGYRN